ncbi:MAG: serine/threonine-protein kinase [Myxococcota bacterium]
MPSQSQPEVLSTGDFIDATWNSETAPADSARDELLGVTLNGTYAVERVLGEGGMGRVYLARHTRVAKKRVAVKVLREEFARNEEVLQRFQREAEAGASVSHPNVMTVFDVDRTPNGAAYLVCEYLEGIDLGAHLKQFDRLTVHAALHIAQALCHGLIAAHASGVVHRDLKPQNVFLLGDRSRGAAACPDVKILDFGLSRFLDAGDGSLTKTGYIMGTPAYMAPEQAKGLRVDQRVDVYGVGAILYTALTGRPPFEADTPQATVLAVVSSEPPRPRSLVPSIPVSVELLLERALAREPADRYPDMKALLAAVESIVADSPLTTPEVAQAPNLARVTHALGMEGADDAAQARLRLVLYIAAAAFLLVGSTITGVTGLELVKGYGFNHTELRLLLLAILGLSLTPATLWLLRIRSHVWDKSSRVLELLGHLRAAVLTFAVSYGVFGLGLRFVDHFLVRLIGNPRVQPVGVHWPGWNIPLATVALVLAIYSVLRRVIAGGMRSRVARFAVEALLATLAFAATLGLLYFGWRWHSYYAPTLTR